MAALRKLGMGRSEMENRINVHKDSLILRLTEIIKNVINTLLKNIILNFK